MSPRSFTRQRIWQLISNSLKIWRAANAERMAASLTFYSLLSLAPILTLAIAITSFFFDPSLAHREIVNWVSQFSNDEIAATVGGVVEHSNQPSSGIIAGAISLIVLIFAASGVFSQLHDTFNDIWHVPREQRSSLRFLLKQRTIGVVLVLIVGLLLLAALLQSATVEFISTSLTDGHPRLVAILSFADRAVSYLLMPLIFALIFRYFPAVRIRFSDVWLAGLLTAVCFAGSRYLIQLYLRLSSTSEVYGAAGSLVILLIWIYLNGLLVFYGAAFSHAWTVTFGSQGHNYKQYLSDPEQVLKSLRGGS